MAVNATAIWRVRPSGSNTNGGGYDPGISGAATDYSQQNAAQASGTNGVTTGTTTFTDATALAFTSAMVGNAMYITGSGQTTGFYFVTAYTSSSIVTLDRSPGTGTGATWNLGGGWADFWTNTTSSGPLAPGNYVYILGSGVPNPASYTYDYSPSSSFTPANGSNTVGPIRFIGDPSTPSFSSGGWPCIKVPSGSSGDLFLNCQYAYFQNIWLVASTNNGYSHAIFSGNFGLINANTIVIDMLGYNSAINWTNGNSTFGLIGSEVFSSVSSRGSTGNALFNFDSNGCYMIGCNVHDCISDNPIYIDDPAIIANNILAKNTGATATIYIVQSTTYAAEFIVSNNTIDGNGGDAIGISHSTSLQPAAIFNNLISNQTGAGKYGINVSAGTAAANNLIKNFIDYNTFYNNTSNYNGISAGPHDTALGTNPYVGQSTENYTLA